MALTVTVYNPSLNPPAADTTYSLLATSVEHNFTRYPIQTAQPGVSSSKADRSFQLDLGQTAEKIAVQGIIDVSGTPTKAQISEAVEGWWTNSTTNTDLLKVIIDDSGYWYYCRFQSASFEIVAAELNRWTFQISFLVDSRGGA